MGGVGGSSRVSKLTGYSRRFNVDLSDARIAGSKALASGGADSSSDHGGDSTCSLLGRALNRLV